MAHVPRPTGAFAFIDFSAPDSLSSPGEEPAQFYNFLQEIPRTSLLDPYPAASDVPLEQDQDEKFSDDDDLEELPKRPLTGVGTHPSGEAGACFACGHRKSDLLLPEGVADGRYVGINANIPSLVGHIDVDI